MSSKNSAAVARFGELYRTAWVRLSERHDEIPHFSDIAASYDKLVSDEQGRALVYLFRSSRGAQFRTDGDDLVSMRNRAAFMVALAQYKKELSAPQVTRPAAESSTKQGAAKRHSLPPVMNARKPARIHYEQDAAFLQFDNGSLFMDVKVCGFFPLTRSNEDKILPYIAGALDADAARELLRLLLGMVDFESLSASDTQCSRISHNISSLADLLEQRNLEDVSSEYRAAAHKIDQAMHNAFGGLEFGKVEPFTVYSGTRSAGRMVEKRGQSVTKGSLTFHVYKHTEKHKTEWRAIESTTGLSAASAKSKKALIQELIKLDLSKITPENLERLRFRIKNCLNAAKCATNAA